MTVLLRRLILCLIATNIKPAKDAMNVEIRIGKNTSVGDSAPDRNAKIEMGIIVRPDVFSTKNIIWALDARSLLGLIS